MSRASTFSPPLAQSVQWVATTAVEIELETSDWGSAYWSEIDAICVHGLRPKDLPEAPAASLGPYIRRMAGETERSYALRPLPFKRSVWSRLLCVSTRSSPCPLMHWRRR